MSSSSPQGGEDAVTQSPPPPQNYDDDDTEGGGGSAVVRQAETDNMEQEGEGESTASDDTVSLECPICLQNCIFPVQLDCQHVFCFLCIKGVATQGQSRCSLCRAPIPHSMLTHPKLKDVSQLYKHSKADHEWFYEARGGGWWQYDERTMQEMDKAYESGLVSFQLLIAGIMYEIDFAKMIQYRINNPNMSRRIKRDAASAEKRGVAGIRLDQSTTTPSTLLTTSTVSGADTLHHSNGNNNAPRGHRRGRRGVGRTTPTTVHGVGPTSSQQPTSPSSASASGGGGEARGIDNDGDAIQVLSSGDEGVDSDDDPDSLEEEEDDEMELGEGEEEEELLEESEHSDDEDGEEVRDGARAPTSRRSNRSTSSNNTQTPPPSSSGTSSSAAASSPGLVQNGSSGGRRSSNSSSGRGRRRGTTGRRRNSGGGIHNNSSGTSTTTHNNNSQLAATHNGSGTSSSASTSPSPLLGDGGGIRTIANIQRLSPAPLQPSTTTSHQVNSPSFITTISTTLNSNEELQPEVSQPTPTDSSSTTSSSGVTCLVIGPGVRITVDRQERGELQQQRSPIPLPNEDDEDEIL